MPIYQALEKAVGLVGAACVINDCNGHMAMACATCPWAGFFVGHVVCMSLR